ncbi:PAQR family membrane homeostasis protein TrhA [Roseovarius salis]|uniref:PAQR family membrane homeostasis protein TrhA n=1 Tax=Roseovarius salis TaxID=3376063 RepID=UPI0037CA6B13
MPYPNYTKAERIADGVVHVLGVTAALVGVTVLFATWSQHMGWSIFLASSVYALALLLMLGASAAYHLASHTALRPLLRRIDHAAIYVKIAGSFTPLSIMLGTVFGYVVLGLVWCLALAGAATKLMTRPGAMTMGWAPQVALGWIGLAIIVPLWELLPGQSVALIVAGGLTYTLAIVFYRWDDLHFANAIWHAFVLVATGCLFLGISTALAVAVQPPV